MLGHIPRTGTNRRARATHPAGHGRSRSPRSSAAFVPESFSLGWGFPAAGGGSPATAEPAGRCRARSALSCF
eukprot:4994355-Pyramimonas_sp.AAC.2